MRCNKAGSSSEKTDAGNVVPAAGRKSWVWYLYLGKQMGRQRKPLWFASLASTRAVRYEIKVYRFILCSIVYIVVSQNTLFPVIPFHHLSDCDLYTPPTTGYEGETEALKQVENGQLIPK